MLCCQCLTKAIKKDLDSPHNNESIARMNGLPLAAFNKAEIALMRFNRMIDFAPAAATTYLKTTSYVAAGSGSESTLRDRKTSSSESAGNDVNMTTQAHHLKMIIQ
jgi:hypothetical protein